MSDYDPMAELERLDRFLNGEEEGDIPMELLRGAGLEIPPDDSLDDDALRGKLWEIIEAMASIGMLVEDTDHLSDRELYRFLVNDALLVPEILTPGGHGFCHVSPIGGCSNEDLEVYLRYYADERTRAEWDLGPGETLPSKEQPPFDRDRFLPGADGWIDVTIQS